MKTYDGLGLLVGGVGVACSIYMYFRLRSISSKIDLTVEELANKSVVDVSSAMIDKAVRQAVDREVGKSVSWASNAAVRSVSENLRVQVKKSVDEKYSSVEKAVSDELSRQVSNLDMTRLKEDVTAKAKTAILEKFDGRLDDVLGEFNRNLENVSKIYGSIANTMTKQQEKEMVFKIN